MVVGIIVVSIFILPLFLHLGIQKYGISEVPDEVQDKSIEVVSSFRNYRVEQISIVVLELSIGMLYGGVLNLLESELEGAIALISMSLLFFLLFIFIVLYIRNRVVVFCVDGIVCRTIFGKIRHYPENSIRGYYYVKGDLCIKTNYGMFALNGLCTNYRIVQNVVKKYPRL